MQKIVELNQKEKDLVSGGDSFEGSFSCNSKSSWRMNEGPCVRNETYVCIKIKLIDDSGSSSVLDTIIEYAAKVTFLVLGVGVGYAIQRTRMAYQLKKSQ